MMTYLWRLLETRTLHILLEMCAVLRKPLAYNNYIAIPSISRFSHQNSSPSPNCCRQFADSSATIRRLVAENQLTKLQLTFKILNFRGCRRNSATIRRVVAELSPSCRRIVFAFGDMSPNYKIRGIVVREVARIHGELSRRQIRGQNSPV